MMRTFLLGLFLAVTFVCNGVAERESAVATRTSFARAVKATAPSVVNIFAAKRVMQRVAPEFINDPLFAQLFAGQGPMRARFERSLGSGVIVDERGILVTNLHVIDGADAMKIVLADGREVGAQLINSDEKLDIAVLRIDLPEGARVPAVRFGDSDTLQVGDVVLAVGNPFGIGQSVSMGVVSAVDRSNAALSKYGQFIQTDVAINPGNSGGALIDSTGALIGINTAIFTKTGGSQGISFAIPANLVRAVVRDIVTTGHVNRPWFGGVGQNVTSALAERLQLRRPTGVLISDVVEGSPADRAGVREGDVILALDGRPVSDPASLNEHILSAPDLLDRTARLTVWRQGAERELSITFEALPERRPADQVILGGTGPLAGATVERLSPALNVDLNLPLTTQGIAVIRPPQETRRFSLFGTSLQPGDVLLAVNGKTIRTLRDITDATNERAQEWRIRLQRANRVYNIVIR